MSLSQLIGGAAKVARNRLHLDNVPRMDYEDIAQSAALGWVKGQQARPDDEVYHFVAAKNEAMKHILKSIFGKDRTYELHSGYFAEEETDVSSIELTEGELTDLFLRLREKQGERGFRAAQRDAKICKLLLKGYSNEGIAQEMEISVHNIRKYRSQICKRLREKMKGVK